MSGRVNVLLLRLLLESSSVVGDRLRRDGGQTFVEYALLMLFVTVALAGGAFLSPVRSGVEDALSVIAGAISAAGSG